MTPWQRQGGLLCLYAAVLGAAFHADWWAMVQLWWTSSTFTHCLILVPLIGWLVWLRVPVLRDIAPSGWWPPLLWVSIGALLWLAGDAASVALLRQAGAIVMAQGIVAATLGPAATHVLLFPLGYAVFLVPFGEELVPAMQTLTAHMATALLHLTGYAATLDGIFITTAFGVFAVAEACSGVKFLVAMAALAVLASHLCFTGWRRRTLFLIAAIIVPMLANGVRAFGTIWMAAHWGTAFAEGADHIIYGWLFFAIVIAGVFLLARPWFDRAPDALPSPPVGSIPAATGFGLRGAAAGAAALGAALLPAGWSAMATARAAPITLAPVDVPAGWQALSLPLAGARSAPGAGAGAGVGSGAGWRAHFAGADAADCTAMARGGTPPVIVCRAGYAWQGEGRELVGYGQGAWSAANGWRWAAQLPATEAVLGQQAGPGAGPGQGPGPAAGAARIDRLLRRGEAIEAMTLYRAGGRLTASAARVKLAALAARLGGGDERAYAIVVAAPATVRGEGAAEIGRLIAAYGGIEAMAARLTGPRQVARD